MGTLERAGVQKAAQSARRSGKRAGARDEASVAPAYLRIDEREPEAGGLS